MSASGVMDGMPPGFVSPAAFWFATPPAPGAQAPPAAPAKPTKSSGLGAALWLGGYDISHDIQQFKIGAPAQVFDFTDITESAYERQLGRRDGQWNITPYHNPGPAANAAHPVLSPLPTADVLATICPLTPALAGPAACMQAKQANYDPTRDTKGMLTFAVQLLADGFGMEWGLLMTPGLRTDTAATNGTAVDAGAATSFGMQAYLQVTAFTGTDITVKLQDSPDNVTFADLASGAFTQVTGAPATQRIASVNTAIVRRYVRVATVTTGGFTTATFGVVMVRNPVAGQVF